MVAERPGCAFFGKTDISAAKNGGKETGIVTAGTGKQWAQGCGGKITGFMGFQYRFDGAEGNPFP